MLAPRLDAFMKNTTDVWSTLLEAANASLQIIRRRLKLICKQTRRGGVGSPLSKREWLLLRQAKKDCLTNILKIEQQRHEHLKRCSVIHDVQSLITQYAITTEELFLIPGWPTGSWSAIPN